MDRDNRRIRRWVGLAIVVIIIVVIAVVVAVFFQDKEQHISSSNGDALYGSIDCQAANPQDVFFELGEKAASTTSTVKAIAQDGELDRISYTLEAIFDTPQAAEDASTAMHIDYDKYMGSKGKEINDSFSVVKENHALVELSTEWEELTAGTAKPFGLTEEDLAKVDEDKLQTLADALQAKGYSCVVDD